MLGLTCETTRLLLLGLLAGTPGLAAIGLVIAALTRAGIVTAADSAPMVGALVNPGGAQQTQGPVQ